MASPNRSYQDPSKHLSRRAVSGKRKSEQINGLQNPEPEIGTDKRCDVLNDSQPSESTPQQNQVCDRCKSLDLEDALKPPAGFNGRLIMTLGEVTKDMRLSPCPLCRLFAAVHSPLKPPTRRKGSADNRGHHLRAFSGLAISSSKKRNLGGSMEPGVALGVAEGLTKVGFNPDKRRKCFAHGLIAPVVSPTSRSSIFQVRLVDPANIDLEQIQRW
ncbi:hypothetical protein DL98DRAFT_599355 [Cadophora sp. DSE1049]|nr:hypothetical protein DL98DRAFT_599355 [Cadophora sp. DSE1049]